MYSDEIMCNQLTRIADTLENIFDMLSANKPLPKSFKEQVNENQLMTDKEAATYLGLNKGTLSVWRSNKRYNLPVIKVGRSVRYKRSDLDLWLATRRPF